VLVRAEDQVFYRWGRRLTKKTTRKPPRPYAGESMAEPDPAPEIVEIKRLDRLRAIAPALIGSLITGETPSADGKGPEPPIKRRRVARESDVVLDQHTDGPPQVQRVAVIGIGGLIIRDAIVEPVEWKDPDDAAARFKKTGARTIRGWKRVWTIDVLHRKPNSEVSEAHVKAATRLVDDHQRREGVVSGGRASGSDTDMGPIDVRVAAGIRYEAAMEFVGVSGASILFRVVILNWTLAKLAERIGSTSDRTLGRLMAVLDRLVEHYDSGKRKRPHAPSQAAPDAPPEPEPEATGLPMERSGRWRDEKPTRGRKMALDNL
jgi:hypothetical protein